MVCAQKAGKTVVANPPGLHVVSAGRGQDLKSPGRSSFVIVVNPDALAGGLFLLGEGDVWISVPVEIGDLQGPLVDIAHGSYDMLHPRSIAGVGWTLIPHQVAVVVHGSHNHVHTSVAIEIRSGAGHISRETRKRVDYVHGPGVS